MSGVGVGPGIGPPWRKNKSASPMNLALGLVSDVKVFMLAKTGQLRARGQKLVGLIRNLRL